MENNKFKACRDVKKIFILMATSSGGLLQKKIQKVGLIVNKILQENENNDKKN